MSLGALVHMHIESRGQCQIPSSITLDLIFETRPSISPGTCWFCWAGGPMSYKGSTFLHFYSATLGLQVYDTILSIYRGARNSETVPYICAVTKLSSHAHFLTGTLIYTKWVSFKYLK